jgi:EAL and modified HD-GYP domain-containing signal transduction protein
MATQTNTLKSPEAIAAELAGSLRYMARQPILDLRGKVHAYELLLRSGPEAGFHGDHNLATRAMLDNTVLFGFEKLTGGLPGFVNCTAEALTGKLVDVLPPNLTVLEIHSSIDPTPEIVEACKKLKSQGFRIALDDFEWKTEFAPMLELADYIKVDFATSGVASRQEIFRRVFGKKIVLIAEKVESPQEYQQAREEGFTLFQGYYFCRPILLKNRSIPSNQLFHIQILKLLHDEPLDFRKLSDLVKLDASLTYRLLRLVNSPMCAVRQEVRSIETALIAVGEDNFRHIATLAITSELSSSQPAEILRMAFVRGRFCEQAAEMCALAPGEQYLLGLLSLLPAMLRVAMDELTPSLPLRDPIRQALHGNSNRERRLLDWLEYHEAGCWAACDAIVRSNTLNPDLLVQCYADAVMWAENAMNFSK